MEYRDKYLKYKNKYLKLKNQLGGAGLDLYLPSDITSITQKFMIKVEKYKRLTSNLPDVYHYVINDEHPFIQDPTIIFNRLHNPQKYIIQLGSINYNVPQLEDAEINNTYKTNNELLFGGNFISLPGNPNVPNNLGLILCTKTENNEKTIDLDKLLQFIRSNLNDNQKILDIKCSFQHLSGGLHIDEVLCPMPYIQYQLFPGYNMNYKIWIYIIRSINFDNVSIPSILKNISIDPRTIDPNFINYSDEQMLEIAQEIKQNQNMINERTKKLDPPTKTQIKNEFYKNLTINNINANNVINEPTTIRIHFGCAITNLLGFSESYNIDTVSPILNKDCTDILF